MNEFKFIEWLSNKDPETIILYCLIAGLYIWMGIGHKNVSALKEKYQLLNTWALLSAHYLEDLLGKKLIKQASDGEFTIRNPLNEKES